MKNKSNLIIIFLISIFFYNLTIILSDEDTFAEESIKAQNSPDEFKNMYQKMLIGKRKTQHDAVKRVLELKNPKKEKEMLSLVIKKLFDTLKSSLEKLAKLQTDNKQGLKLDQNSLNDVSMIIENTAFAADLSLHFPDYFHKLYDKNKEWQFILESSIGLSIKTGLLDNETSNAINLMSQELNIIEKEPNYSNPYKNKNKKSPKLVEPEPEPEDLKKKKKEKKKRGPGLSGGRSDL